MNLKGRNTFLLIILLLSTILLPVLVGASILNLMGEEDFSVDILFVGNFGVDWMRVQVQHMSVVGLGLSLFASFVLYLGGHSRHHRFNDRTLDHIINLLMVRDLRTAPALRRNVFNFSILQRIFSWRCYRIVFFTQF